MRLTLTIALQLFVKSMYKASLKYKMSVMSHFYHWEVPVIDVLKTVPYRESSQIGKRRFVAKLLSVWCGSVSYPRAAVFHFVNVILAYLLHGRTVEPQKLPLLSNTRTQQYNKGGLRYVTRQRLCKHISAYRTMLCNAVTSSTIRTVFSMGSVQSAYKRSEFVARSRGESRVEAGSNTSTVALVVVGGDEKGSLEYETVKYGRESHETRTRE
jgi:hypothetical protein